MSETKIARLAGYKPTNQSGNNQKLNKDQGRSYLTNPLAKAVVAAAGGDPRYPELHNPGWCKSIPAILVLLENLLDAALPCINTTHKIIHQAFNNCTSHRERREKRLFMVRGSINVIKFSTEQAFLMLASRPMKKVKGLWKLEVESPPIFEAFGDHRHQLFCHEIFESQDFLQLVDEVKTLQDQEHDADLDLSPQAETKLERIVERRMLPQFKAMLNHVNDLTAMVKTVLQERELAPSGNSNTNTAPSTVPTVQGLQHCREP